MPGLSTTYRQRVLAHFLGQTRFAPVIASGAHAAVWIGLHFAPAGPLGTANGAGNGRKLVQLGDPTTGTTLDHIIKVLTTLDVVWADFIAAGGDDVPTVLTDWSAHTGDTGDGTSICILRAPIGGYPYRACSVSSISDSFVSAGSGLADGNAVEVFAEPGADPTLPGFGLSPDTRYWVVNATGPTFQLSVSPGGPPVNITADGGLRVARAKKVSVNNHGTVRILAGDLAFQA